MRDLHVDFGKAFGGEKLEDNRLARIGYGLASPLWAPFLLAAGAGVAFWAVTAWTRGGGATTAPASSPPAADPDLSPGAVDRPENVMAHNPPPVEAPAAPADPAPKPEVPAEHVMDHTPPESVDASAAPEVEEKLGASPKVDAEPAVRSKPKAKADAEPGAKASLLAQTSATALSGTDALMGDMRADEAAAPSLESEDAESVLADAAYAQNFGPVVAPEVGGAPSKPKRSRKAKVLPGTAP